MSNPNLKCYEGTIRIANKQECLSKSKYISDASTVKQYLNFLKWLPPLNNINDPYKYSFDTSKSDKGDCYYGNWWFKDRCLNSFTDDGDPAYGQIKGKLKYDEDVGRCLITREYCQATGQAAYEPPPGGDESTPGGTCELNGGQKALDFFLGQTAARGSALSYYGYSCPGKK